ncbi:hypothetical protein [Novosphingobium taihuense]|uniref:Haem-binding uptake Tiki superfamily ChaN domain-containing protein n=2 Tax=Novosphingobium taihuense TaxID=260085 RepID=A0A7W7AGG2_9SPHN|nr:hypothetical protein [Novosphingobium taihuense]MBB4615809.1 hypothetical protein [Novosphingobium taihuense]
MKHWSLVTIPFLLAASPSLGSPSGHPTSPIIGGSLDCSMEHFPNAFNFATWGSSTKGCYLEELHALERYQVIAADPDDQFEISSRIAELRGMMGDELAAYRKTDDVSASSAESERLLGDPTVDQFDALTKITELAAKTRVVVINEAHFAPHHRMFSRLLVRRLSAAGFSFLGAEAFNAEPEQFARSFRGGAPTHQTGYYVRDPVFGNLVREALMMGYKLVPYELTHVEMDSAAKTNNFQQARERGQAERLYKRALKDKPRAKLIVLVGFDHVKERLAPNGSESSKRMASYLRELVGEDILTVDQVAGDLTGRFHVRGQDCSGVSQFHGKPVVLTRNEEPLSLGRYSGLVDVSVVHRCTGIDHDRPTWLQEARRVRPLLNACANTPRDRRVLAQAFLQTDPPDAVPVDQVLRSSGGSNPTLIVPEQAKVRVECRVE